MPVFRASTSGKRLRNSLPSGPWLCWHLANDLCWCRPHGSAMAAQAAPKQSRRGAFLSTRKLRSTARRGRRIMTSAWHGSEGGDGREANIKDETKTRVLWCFVGGSIPNILFKENNNNQQCGKANHLEYLRARTFHHSSFQWVDLESLPKQALRIADVSNLPQSQYYRVSEMGNWKSELNTFKFIFTKKNTNLDSWYCKYLLKYIYYEHEHIMLLMEEILHQLIGSLSYYLQGVVHQQDHPLVSPTNSPTWVLKLVGASYQHMVGASTPWCRCLRTRGRLTHHRLLQSKNVEVTKLKKKHSSSWEDSPVGWWQSH